MNQQRTLHISFPEGEVDLYNEIMRESALTYSPVASVARRHIRKSILKTSLRQLNLKKYIWQRKSFDSIHCLR